MTKKFDIFYKGEFTTVHKVPSFAGTQISSLAMPTAHKTAKAFTNYVLCEEPAPVFLSALSNSF